MLRIQCFAEVVRNYQLQKDTLNRFRHSFTFQYAYDISFLEVLPLRIKYETYFTLFTSHSLTFNK
jgi:hypothetical protein